MAQDRWHLSLAICFLPNPASVCFATADAGKLCSGLLETWRDQLSAPVPWGGCGIFSPPPLPLFLFYTPLPLSPSLLYCLTKFLIKA